MAILQHKRGSAEQVASYTPAAGELVVDTTNYRLVIGDGATEGGKALTISGGISSDTADKWANARTLMVNGSNTGSVSIDGSTDVTLTLTQGDIDLGALS